MKTFKHFLDKKTLTNVQLSKRHKVSLKTINTQVKKGIAVEKEHTSKSEIAKEIAQDHVGEDPKYYDKLKKVEKSG